MTGKNYKISRKKAIKNLAAFTLSSSRIKISDLVIWYKCHPDFIMHINNYSFFASSSFVDIDNFFNLCNDCI